MAGFLGPLRIEEIPGDDRRWRLLEPCIYYIETPIGPWFVEAPIYFITDFGSIPQLLWWIPGLSPFGKYRRAYAIHDKLYRAPVVRTDTYARAITRLEADAILVEALAVLAAPPIVRDLVWFVIGQFGAEAWDDYRREELLARQP